LSITTDGIEAEKKARLLLKERGWLVQQIDWIGKKDDKWVIFEIKQRELYTPPPFLGTGLDKSQLFLRNELLKDLGLRTMLIVFVKNTKDVYCQYIDILEAGEHFDTKNNIRIYPIKNFKRIQT
jgi:hypothetical protein